MTGSLAAADVNFVSLKLAVFCVQCELLSEDNTPRCLACGSAAVLSLSRVLGGSLGGQQTAHLIADAELDLLVRSLLRSVPQVSRNDENEVESLSSGFSSRHHVRVRRPGPAALHRLAGAPDLHPKIDPGEIDL